MNKTQFYYLIIFICFILLFLSIIFPNILSWLVVLVFVGFITKLCFDGIQVRQYLLDKTKLEKIVRNINHEIDTTLRNFSDNQLYKINKLSLLDKIYRENNELQIWEKKQRYYQNLPNLLLAFGLLGTFVGITINLFLLSRNTGGEIPLDKTLEDIIGSMAISFISSLAALVSSLVITKFYPPYDLEVEKNHIFNQVEYYIENECQILLYLPTVQEKIDALTQSLVNLPQTIKDLEKSVSLSSQKIVTSTNTFQTKMDNASNKIERSSNFLHQTTSNLVKITQDFSNFISTLTTSSESLDKTTIALGSYTENLQTVIHDLNNLSSNIQSLIVSNHNELSNISSSLETNVNSLIYSIQDFEQNISQVKSAINNNTGQVSVHNSHLQKLSKQLVNYSQILQSIQQDLRGLIE